MTAPRPASIRLAIGLRSTIQSLSLVARAAGLFEKAGLEFTVAEIETAGPAGIRGLLGGDWEFAEFGAVPVANWAFGGADPVILLSVEHTHALYILGGKETKEPRDLVGKEIGVLTRDGQTGYSAEQMIRRWDLEGKVETTPLMRYPRVFDALREGRIAAGVLTADYRFAAAPGDGLRVLADLGEEFRFQGPVVATTRDYLARHRDIAERVVRCYAEAIHVFKTRPDITLPVLEKHLDFADAEGVRRIYDFYAPRLSRIPRPSLQGLANVIASVGARQNRERKVTVSDIYDSSVLDGLEASGFFRQLYAQAPAETTYEQRQ